MSLEKYWRKRKFGKTLEPKGKRKERRLKRNRIRITTKKGVKIKGDEFHLFNKKIENI